MSELLKCPFCGGDNVGIWHNHMFTQSFEARCYDCHFGLAQSDTEEKAIKAWNTRKPMDKIVKRLEEKSFWLELSFDDDGYCEDDSEEAIFLHDAIRIIKEEGGI